MSANLDLQFTNRQTRERINLFQTPTDASLRILPARTTIGKEPTLQRYLDWVKESQLDDVARLTAEARQIATYRQTAKTLRDQGDAAAEKEQEEIAEGMEMGGMGLTTVAIEKRRIENAVKLFAKDCNVEPNQITWEWSVW